MQRLPAFGGVNTYVFDLIQSLKNKNINVDLVCQSDIDNLPEKSLKRIDDYRELLRKRSEQLPEIIINYEVGKFAFKELIKNLDIDKYDIIHSQDGIFSKACKEVYPNKPLIGTIHGSFLDEMTLLGIIRDEFSAKLISRYDYWAVECPDMVIIPSIHIDPSIPKIPNGKRKIISHGVDVNVFSPREKTNSTMLKIVTASSLFYYKGLDILMEALLKLKNDKVNFTVEIYGDGPEKSRLKKISVDSKLPVSFKGKIDRERLPVILSKADVFVQASRIESFGLSVTEAMACVCVPVCSAVGGLKDQVKHMENGLLFESENSDQLFQNLKLLANDKKLYQLLSKKARNTILDKFSLEKMTEETIEAYREAINKGKIKTTFTKIYKRNSWGSYETVSGTGSSIDATKELVKQIPILIDKLHIRTLIDAPCGDFNWMKHVELNIEKYIGIDIVPELINNNQQNYTSDNRKFLNLDITRDNLPQADIILCRDCLVHLSFNDIEKAIKNFQKSNSQYLLTTSFTDRANNEDITTGEWRPINLELEPFNFPKPLYLINEKCMEEGGEFADKSLALWRVADLPIK